MMNNITINHMSKSVLYNRVVDFLSTIYNKVANKPIYLFTSVYVYFSNNTYFSCSVSTHYEIIKDFMEIINNRNSIENIIIIETFPNTIIYTNDMNINNGWKIEEYKSHYAYLNTIFVGKLPSENYSVINKSIKELSNITANIFTEIKNNYSVGLDDYYDWKFYVFFKDGSYVVYIPTTQELEVENKFYNMFITKLIDFIIIINSNTLYTNNSSITVESVNSYVRGSKILSDYVDTIINENYERIN